MRNQTLVVHLESTFRRIPAKTLLVDLDPKSHSCSYIDKSHAMSLSLFAPNAICFNWCVALWILCDLANAQEQLANESPASLKATNQIIIDGAILKTVEVTSVAAQVPGLLSAVSVREGDRVKVSAPIAAIQSTTTELQLQRAKVAMDVAQKNFESTIDTDLAQKNFAVAENEFVQAIEANKRVQDVYPPMEVDRLRLVRDRAKLEIDRTVHAKDIAKLEMSKIQIEHLQLADLLDKHQVRAPVSGMVVAVEKRVGEWVEAGTVVLRLVEIDRLRIEGFMHAEQADSKWLDCEAQVELLLSGKPIRTTAKLVFISPEVNPINSQVRVHLDVDNRDGKLRPGLRPKVWIPSNP
jgi:multidrug efflux pump subunit AcrA (membrane-fusion protein)